MPSVGIVTLFNNKWRGWRLYAFTCTSTCALCLGILVLFIEEQRTSHIHAVFY